MKLAARSFPRERGESGFTLIEVMVAIIVEALIMGALGMAFTGVLKGTSQVSQSLNRSGDARIAATYITADARASSGPEISLSDTTSCPDPSPPVAGTQTAVVRFNWNSTGTSGTTANIVNYVLVSNSLLRRQCAAGVLVGDSVVARSVQSVTVVCAPTANCSGAPTAITATVTETADNYGANYQYSLTATFQKLIGAGPPTVASSVVVLGAGSNCGAGATGISLAGGAALHVYGKAFLDAADGSTCKAMDISNGASFSAGATSILAGGSCVGSPQSLCPAATSFSPAIADPYAGYTPPSTSGMPSRTGCSGTAQPGVYAATLSATSGPCTLASGVYVLQNGLTISNGASLTTAAGGVFIYITGGAFTVGGGSPVSISAMTTGTYAGLAVWQAAADTSTISWANGGTLTFTGAIYAPKAQVNIQGGSLTSSLAALVVQTIVMANGGGINIGAQQALSISGPATLPAWTVNRPLYPNTPIIATGGDGVAYNWSSSGLPAGMAINAVSGVVSGMPTAAGAASVAVTVSDASGDVSAPQAYTLTVNAAPAITGATLPNGELTVPYSATPATTGGTAPFTWSASGLPAGLSIDASTGAITGTPNGSVATANVALSLVDAAGATASATLSLSVLGAVSITTASLPAGEKTVAYSTTLTGSAGKTPYSWSATGLPAGLSIAAVTGVISGTPTGTGTSNVAITLTDALGGTASTTLSLTVNPQPTITSVTLTNGGATAGQLEKGDTVTVVFSAEMRETTLCSAWSSGDAVDRLINADSNVTVAISDGSGATNDALTVTSTTCTFNFGSLNLGSNAYVSAATTFGGTSTNVSTITWTASSHTLVIKLGAKIAGTVATVSTSTPIYTAAAGIRDSVGAALSNSPLTLGAGKKF